MKHTPWKTAVAAVAGTSLLLGLGACGRSEGASTGASAGAVTSIDSEPATGDLTVWAMGNEGDLLGDFVDGFKEENPDVNITVTAIPWASAHDKVQTAIAAGTVPDVIQMGTTWMADFADAFAPVPENFDLSDFSDGPLEAGQVNGQQLGVPWYVDSHVLYYRTDIAEQAGWDHAPETLDELRQMAEDVKQVDGVENGMYISPSGADSWQGTLWAFFSSGVSLMDDEGNWTLDTPEMHEATEYIDGFFKNGIIGTNLDVTPGVSISDRRSGRRPRYVRHRRHPEGREFHLLRRRRRLRGDGRGRQPGGRLEVHPVDDPAGDADRMVQDRHCAAVIAVGLGGRGPRRRREAGRLRRAAQEHAGPAGRADLGTGVRRGRSHHGTDLQGTAHGR